MHNIVSNDLNPAADIESCLANCGGIARSVLLAEYAVDIVPIAAAIQRRILIVSEKSEKNFLTVAKLSMVMGLIT